MTPTLWLAVLLLAAGAPALKEKAPPPNLVGAWVPESVTVNGNPTAAGTDRWEFRADGTWGMSNEGQPIASGTYTQNPKAAPPNANLVHMANEQTNLCLFRVDGDTLTLSVGHDPAVRPADLQPGTKATVWVFKRVKDR
jgi:uncharacterized protein (TIGR03067 family)